MAPLLPCWGFMGFGPNMMLFPYLLDYTVVVDYYAGRFSASDKYMNSAAICWVAWFVWWDFVGFECNR
uniref:Uncharacterized protein n=1 Tax=Rhizophora mucronata TaxID=61149 RepID=A0A2P2NZL7_RHIMU